MKKILMMSLLAASIGANNHASAKSPEVTLRFSHFVPAVAKLNTDLFQTWADSVEKDSNGRIKVEMFPSSTLAKPPAQYDAVKHQIADVSFSLPGYTANRFPLTQLVELPGVVKNAKHGSCIVQSLYDEGVIASEFSETKPLFLFTHGQGHIHTAKHKITSPEDFKGLRIRQPTVVVGNILSGLGAKPIGMPAPQSYQSLQRGVIDGVATTWDATKIFRLDELTNYHTEVGGLYSATFVVAMNKNVYKKLPADLKKIIDDNSGVKWSQAAASVFDTLDNTARAEAVSAGHNINVIDNGAENPEWKPILTKATEGYINGLEAKGLPAKKVYQRTLELSASCES